MFAAGVGQTIKREAVSTPFFKCRKALNERMIIGGDVMNGGIIFQQDGKNRRLRQWVRRHRLIVRDIVSAS